MNMSLDGTVVMPLASTTKIDKHIVVVGSTNPRINAINHRSRLAVQAALSERYSKVSIAIVNNIADLEALVAKKPDVVMLGIKRVPLDLTVDYDESPKIWPTDYLHSHGIIFTGSATEAFNLVSNKQAANQKILDAGMRSAPYFVANDSDTTYEHALKFPLFVKPTNRSGGKGVDEMSVVYNQAALIIKIAAIRSSLNTTSLVEEFLPGREFSVAVMRQASSQSLFALPLEIRSPADANGNHVLSQAVRQADLEGYNAVNDLKLKKALNTLAIGAFKALGARDYARIDMRLNAAGVPYFIEANLQPGLADYSYLIECFRYNNHGSYADMLQSIVGLALERKVAQDIS